jgi:homoserine/homoserine lactone efflux protein
MKLETWLLFCATDLVLSLTPGIAVTLVIGTALARGIRAGLLATLGILVANTLYFALSATSVGAVLAASPRVFAVVKWAGALYLVAAGAQAIWGALSARTSHVDESAAEPGAPTSDRSFLRGFVLQAANPKALLFFIAILPQFIEPTESVVRQIVILGASSVSIELAALALYAALAARARGLARNPRWRAGLDALAGALLVFAGVGLAALRA